MFVNLRRVYSFRIWNGVVWALFVKWDGWEL